MGRTWGNWGSFSQEGGSGDAFCAEAPSGAAEAVDGSARASSVTFRLREAKLVKQRDVQQFKVPLLAGDAAEERVWINCYLAYMRRFNATIEDSLWH